MIKTYFKIAWRNLFSNKTSSFINIIGLSVGMTVAILIGLWIWDELSFNKYHKHYNSIGEVMLQQTFNGTVSTSGAIPIALDAEMRNDYGSNFKNIVLSDWTDHHILMVGDKKMSCPGTFMGAAGPELFTLNMLEGTRNGLQDPSSMLISHSIAKALFGDADPMGKLIKLDNHASFTVSGVYEDLPRNTTLHEITFMAPWNYFAENMLPKQRFTDWGDNSFLMYVQIADNTDMVSISDKIKYSILKNAGKEDAKFKPLIFLQPMSKWRLYSEFKNGINTGGAIEYVWLFGIIGMFVLLLACINFMNLSTARSEKRSREVGVRKAMGSRRGQLISQFFCESLVIAMLAFAFSLLLVSVTLPFFNELADKKVLILWGSPLFWIIGLGFTVFTGLIAGSYPALYLSSFKPVKVLKGNFKAGRFAAVPRKALVVLQFTVSVILIIGTIIVFEQIQYAKNRPVGYTREGLVIIESTTDDLHNHFDAMRNDLLNSGAVMEVAESSSPTTGINNNRGDVEWKGKDPGMAVDFGNIRVTTGYGKTVGWQFADGRDFSNQLLNDSSSVILNEAAVKYMGLNNPVGETLRIRRKNFTVIGVTKNMVMESPYLPAKQTIFYISNADFGYVNIRINPDRGMHDALNKIEAVCKIYSPSVPFSYKFADDEYAKKFANEERISTLANFFAILAIFISCLGLFGMASFVAEQRTKEIGVRKVLGASIFNLWKLLSKDFVFLVLISCAIAIPSAYYFMHNWLLNYEYRTEISGWIFVAAGSGALIITLLTVSFQSIKAALMNPVKSLRTE